jgi:DNA-binding HxlR family transcriptional regulator
MLNRTYETQNCSVARALEVVGERWSLLIVRDLMLGYRRFDELHERLGVARNVLAARLERLAEEGVIEKELYQERPARYEYHLTEKGRDLWPVIVGLLSWGDRYLVKGAPPVVLEHRDCGGHVNDRRICERCGAELGLRDAIARPGPGAKKARGRLVPAGRLQAGK